MKVAVIGAGASGLMATCAILAKGHQVVVFDGNDKCGKKIYITGKGRCNLTNLCDKQTFLSNVVRGEKFLQSAISRFSPYDTIAFFENLGLKTKCERGQRIFPVSDKSSDVISALVKGCKGAEFRLNHKVKSVVAKECKFLVDGEEFDRVLVASGGMSYSATGSDGSGYKIAKSFGHKIIDLVPGLVPIETGSKFSSLEGLSLKNVEISVFSNGKKFSQFGEMLFTDRGVSGPIVLTVSSFINRAVPKEMFLDLKPALSEEKLDARLLREFDLNKNKFLKSVMTALLPKRMVDVFLKEADINGDRRVQSITSQKRKRILKTLKCFTIPIKKLYPIENAIITSGGVDLQKIDPKTMQSKLQKGLYFIGEILDVDALTGGFNLQIAFATAIAAASDF